MAAFMSIVGFVLWILYIGMVVVAQYQDYQNEKALDEKLRYKPKSWTK